ncbi:MAG: ABC transporter substrate-binding protein [Pseudonocardiaceae bacterium]
MGPTQSRRFPRVLGLCAVALVLAVTGCSAGSSGGSSTGASGAAAQPVRIALVPFPNLDPKSSGVHQLFELGIAETLTSSAPSGIGLRMDMLAAATRSAPTVWNLTLRPGIQFHNGDPVDAAAVVAALKADSARAFSPDDVTTGTLTVTGPLTFTLTTTSPAGNIPAELANFEQYLIYDTRAYAAAGADLSSLVRRGIFTGPFQPTALSATELTATANRHYWGGPVALPGLRGLFISDPQARVAAVQNGEADIAISVPSGVAAALRGDPRAFFVQGRYARGGAWATFNENPASVFANPVVRKAVQEGIDYRGLVAGLAAQPATSLFPSYAPYAINTQVSDPAKARAALDADGWTVGPDGIRTKAGRRLSFTYLWSPNEDPLHGDLGLALQQQLKAIGADVRIMQVDDPYDNAAKPPDWGISVVSLGMEGIGTPANTMTSFLSSSGGGNLGKINDPRLDGLLTQLNAETDPTAQQQLLTQIQQVIAGGGYGVELAYSQPTFVVAPAYRGFQPAGYLNYATAALTPST